MKVLLTIAAVLVVPACSYAQAAKPCEELKTEIGAKLDAKDARGMTPVDSALGKAGGNSRGGQRIDVHEDTAALLRSLVKNRN